MTRYFVSESTEEAENGMKIRCFGVRSTNGMALEALCFERERAALDELVRELNDEQIDERTAAYVLEDFCTACGLC